MNLYRIGNKVLNLDRLNGILDVDAPTGPEAPPEGAALRALFDQGEIALTGKDAEAFRGWYRHASHNLTPHRDENGEALVSPEDQVRESLEALVAQIDRARPGDSALRRTAHRLRDLVGLFLTGELQPVPAKEFKASFRERGTA
jgi:hypothetical protein